MKWIIALGALIVLGLPTYAQFTGSNAFGTVGAGTSGGGGASCSNQLDFSVACNSQYIGAIFK